MSGAGEAKRTTGRRAWIVKALGHGWRKRCPHCGQGALFRGWAHHLPACAHCHLVFERNPGDTWAFTVLGDRLPVAAMIVIIYFGVFRTHPLVGSGLFALLAVAFFWTTPNRWGVGIALHYIGRVLGGDADDPVPPDLTSPADAQPPSD